MRERPDREMLPPGNNTDRSGLMRAARHVPSRGGARDEATTALRRDIAEYQWLQERAMAAVGVGVVIADARQADLPLLYCNPAFERLTGRPWEGSA